MTVFRTSPTYEQPLVIQDKTSSSWYRWFQNTDLGIPPSSEIPIKVLPSPFVYQPSMKGVIFLSGGAVSSVMISRTKGTFYNTGQTSGAISLAANDQLNITYTSPPSIVFMPS